MCRKIIFSSVIVCFLALSNLALAEAYYWSGAQIGDAGWFDPTNWDPCGVPGVEDLAYYEGDPNWVIVPTDACCLALNINPWGWNGSGDPDVTFTITGGNFDTNCISLSAASDQFEATWDPQMNGNFVVNGGVVTIHESPDYADEDAPPTPGYGGKGLWVGGGASSWWPYAVGHVVINGGTVTTPKIAIYNGDITLNGGLLYDTNGIDNAFIVRDEFPDNKIYVNGGTLRLAGDKVSVLTSLIEAQRIIPENTRGVFVGPYYDANTDTTDLTSTFMPGVAWQSSPGHYDEDVRYHTAHPAAGGINLSWKAGDWIGAGDVNSHYVFLSTVFSDVDTAGVGTAGTASPAYRGVVNQPVDDVNGDPNIFISETGILRPLTYVYWRVDEVNDPCINKGIVWRFRTKTDKATDPAPAEGAGLNIPLELAWTAGDWSPSVHRVYFGTSSIWAGVSTNTTDGRYRGTVSSPVYPLDKLLLPDGPRAAFGPLSPDTTYYWRIDEDSYTGGNATGYTQSFNTGSSANVEDFQEYDTTTDLNSVWLEGPVTCGTRAGSGRIALVRTGRSTRYMQFTYDKTAPDIRYFSEVELPYDSATDFAPDVLLSTPKVLQMRYRGFAINSNDPAYDRMYVAVEDSSGNIGLVQHPDPNAQLTGVWTTWAISYNSIEANGVPNPVDMNYVTDLYLGVGEKCLSFLAGGGDGNILYDDFKVLSSTCVPELGPLADFDGNCVVNVQDLDYIAGAWLDQDQDYNWIDTMSAPSKAPILWYKFDETTGSGVADSGTGDTNDYTGEITNYIQQNWDTDGGRDGGGCIFLPDSDAPSYVEAPTNSLYFHNPHEAVYTGNISFSVWINADLTAETFATQWNGIFGTWNEALTTETLEVHCPSNMPDGPATPEAPCNFIKRQSATGAALSGTAQPAAQAYRPLSDFGGRWNHWVFIKKPTEMQLYCNGNLVGDINTTADPNTTWDDADVAGPLFWPPVGSFRIGTRGTNWGHWAGRLDDFQVYDYALSEEEVQYLATDGTGLLHLELSSAANIKHDVPQDIVNFGDLSLMCGEWLTEKLWP